ncbi:hypothetical protein D3C72_2478230 [compost metagenome]
MSPGADVEEAFRYPSAALDEVTTIHIGSKQCRQGPGQDDALYAQVIARIHS